MRTWSISQSRQWRTCRFWHLLQYVLRPQPAIPEHRDRAFGSLVHRGLEAAFKARSLARPSTGDLSMSDYVPFAVRAIEDDEADVITRVRLDAIKAVTWVLQGLPAPHPAAILAVELPFDLTIGGVRVRGVLDYAIRTGPRSVHVRDWKTGKVEIDSGKLDQNMQLAIYTIAARRIWPWADRITVGLFSVRDRTETVGELSAETLAFFADRIACDAREAEQAENELSAETVDQSHPAQPGEHCARCRFRPYCPVYENVPLPLLPGVDVEAEKAHIAATLARR